MSLTRRSCARSAAHHYPAGRARMCIQRCSCGGRESRRQLISALIQTFVHCRRGWRHSEYRASSGFMEANVSVVTGSTIRTLAFAAPRLMACGGLRRLTHRRHLPAMRETDGSSAPSVPTFGSKSRVVSFICVPAVAGSRDYRKETVSPKRSSGHRGCHPRVSRAGSP